ncbi:MAG: response regulator, partial [Acidobacteriota bacterium]
LDDPRIEVVGVASNGKQAIDILDSGTAVDLVTMDIQMPVMPGDTALKHIMIRHHVPVLIVSAVNPDGWSEIADFLNLGAVDFLPKPESRSDMERYASKLRETVLRVSQATAARFKRRRKAVAAAPEQSESTATQDVLVLIGGEGAYVDWLRLPLNRLCATRTTILIQQLPSSYLPGFCRFLAQEALVETSLLEEGTVIGPGVLHVGNAALPFGTERATEAGLIMRAVPSEAGGHSWEEGLQGWLESLARSIGERLSVCLFSSARTMPSELADTLLGCHARILLSKPEEIMCRQLVESVQPYMHIDPDRVFPFDTAHILEVL